MGLSVEHAVALDAHDSKLADVLRRVNVDLLIHTADPIQGQDYLVARAAIEASGHHMIWRAAANSSRAYAPSAPLLRPPG